MSTPTFAKTHNLIAYLEKPTESEGFDQSIDFLNGSSVKYALTGKHQSSIRRILRLDDPKGTSCLSNTKIFEGLAKMGYEKPSDKLIFYKAFFSLQWKFLIHTILQCLSAKTTSWNEFSSTMASAIICLATNQKFNFSRYILLSLVKNIEAGVPFFMFPRFVQLIINHQLGDMTHHKNIFHTPSLTKKVFANMKRKKHKPKRKHTKEPEVLPTKSQAEHNVPLPSPSHDPLPSGEDSLKLKKLMDLCTNLSNKVLDLESEVIDIKYTYKAKIEKLESKEESSKQGRKIADIDADVEINLEKKWLKMLLITEVVTTAGVYVNAASVQDTVITAAETTKGIVEPNVEANAWKDQKGKYGLAKVKIWKLFDSCEVHCLNLSTIQIFLLVEKMYPLTHVTLEQMVNDVRLEVDDENEMSLELLRLVKRQLNEGGGFMGIIGLHKLVLLKQLSAAFEVTTVGISHPTSVAHTPQQNGIVERRNRTLVEAARTIKIFPPLDNLELTIQRRSRADPTLLNDFEIAAEGPDDLPVPDLRTIEELCQPSLNGRGGPIALISIQATNFGLKNDMIQQV
nr:hypothetical protein [Tanacetum cinerariifolium]